MKKQQKNLGASNRALRRKFYVFKENIHQNFKKLGTKYYKCATVPKYSDKQLREMPAKRRRFLETSVSVIIDDEKKFFLNI